ncbi:GIY-YIG nuclease family protein [Chryseobacterium sp. R2A-55]|uniref:GIY-YIG nuclease family protein n=1 Tax=Chryseobacterium sp. R2A-55 TaxID=2744445 RepID=UPI001F18113A|nr:GIY-YIG nuclease family protein [Chryseobacterium sp. R2A-55]
MFGINQRVSRSFGTPRGGANTIREIWWFFFMIFYIYILFSESSGIYYIGYTTDVSRRFLQHNEFSETSFTSKHRPWKLMAAFEVLGNESDAMKIERFIKKQKSSKFIRKIIDTNTELTGVLAQLVRVPIIRD